MDTVKQAATLVVQGLAYAILVWVLWRIGNWIYDALTRCPHCGQPRAREDGGSERVSARTGYRTRTVVTEHRNTAGEVVGRSETQRQFRVLTEVWRRHHSCRFCNHRWHADSTSVTEDFVE